MKNPRMQQNVGSVPQLNHFSGACYASTKRVYKYSFKKSESNIWAKPTNKRR